MKIEKITTVPEEIEITGATLLSIEEAEALPLRLRKYNNWWWLRSPVYNKCRAAYVYNNGHVGGSGSVDNFDYVVRPALKITDLSSNLKVGDVFIFGEKKFEIVADSFAFCIEDIGTRCFRKDWRAEDANDYEKSDVKKYVDAWFAGASNEKIK